MSARKGSQFERAICKELSKWWTGGNRDDVFWRSSQSGGRATVRGRKGQTTAGSYGDIAALDHVGQPLIQCFTIELKRGKSHGYADELIECSERPKKICKFLETLSQTYEAHVLAKSLSWLLIVKRDHRLPMVYLREAVAARLAPTLLEVPCSIYRAEFAAPFTVRIVGVPLRRFMREMNPSEIISFVEAQTEKSEDNKGKPKKRRKK